MIYLGSTFSLQMVPREGACINVEWITPQETKDILANGYMSLVGHQSTADVLSDMLGMSITMNRVRQGLTYDDILVVG